MHQKYKAVDFEKYLLQRKRMDESDSVTVQTEWLYFKHITAVRFKLLCSFMGNSLKTRLNVINKKQSDHNYHLQCLFSSRLQHY